MSLKTCTKCKKEKTVNYFTKDKTTGDGIYPSCIECVRIKNQISYKKNKDKILDYKRRYHRDNREMRAEYNRKYYKENKDFVLSVNYKYLLNRRKVDPLFKFRCDYKSRIRAALKSQMASKCNKIPILIGCTIREYRKYLEKMFQPGMSWDNHGLYGWHIDHIKPVASFDLSDPEQQKKCFNYKNTQPLWAEDNLKKGSKYSGD